MTHLDPELLALLALGEDAAGAEQRLHLAGCAACRAELEAFARPVAATRVADEPLAVPAPRVWEAIARELRLAGAAPVRRPRRRGVVAAILVAAVVLVVGGVGVGLLTARPAAREIASADLRALPGWQGSTGTAVVERLPGGARIVEVRTTVPPDPATDHEVWLMTSGARRLVSLGMLHGTDGTFTVPAGVDLGRFRLVDISDEPRDGDAAHSGDSIVRGALHS